jgi:hypothetical protein
MLHAAQHVLTNQVATCWRCEDHCEGVTERQEMPWEKSFGMGGVDSQLGAPVQHHGISKYEPHFPESVYLTSTRKDHCTS